MLSHLARRPNDHLRPDRLGIRGLHVCLEQLGRGARH